MTSMEYYRLRSEERSSPGRWDYVTGFRMFDRRGGNLLQDIVFDQHPRHFYSLTSGTISGVSPMSVANEVTEGSGHCYNCSFVILSVEEHGLTAEHLPLLSPQIRFLPALEFMSHDSHHTPDLWIQDTSLVWTIRRMCYGMSNQECLLKSYFSTNELEDRYGHYVANHRCANWGMHIVVDDPEYAVNLVLEDMGIAERLHENRNERMQLDHPLPPRRHDIHGYLARLIEMGIYRIHNRPGWGVDINPDYPSSQTSSWANDSGDGDDSSVEHVAGDDNDLADLLSHGEGL